MKKVFAALAACAVAVSMFAVAGCGGNKKEDKLPEGAIDGNYTEKTPEELGDIIDNINPGDLLGGNISGLGLKVNLSGGASLGDEMGASGSVDLDFKLATDNDGNILGAGTTTVKAEYNLPSGQGNYNLSGTAYVGGGYVYGALKGLSADDMKAKINLATLTGLLGGVGGDTATTTDADVSDGSGSVGAGWQSYLNIANLLALAKEYSVTVGVDTDDGLKLRLSASEETVWKAVAAYFDGELSEAEFTEIKEGVSFNKFVVDVYFALDANNAFKQAKVIVDLDVEVDPSLLSYLFGGSDEGSSGSVSATAAATEVQIPPLQVKAKGSVELYTHSDTVTVPDTLATDESYWDATDTVIEYLGYFLGGGSSNDYVQGPVEQY